MAALRTGELMKSQTWGSLATLILLMGCVSPPTDVTDARNTGRPLLAVGGSEGSGVLINEVDADTPGADTQEFVELYDGGVGNTPLDGMVVVFFNGGNDESYNAFDLDGFTTDAQGFFLLGNEAVVPPPDIVFSNNGLQNGPDAVALYVNDASAFPSGTPVTTDNLVDAVVYDTDDADDAELLGLLNPGQPQVNEAGAGDKDAHSIQRVPDGSGGARNTETFVAEPATPGPQSTGSSGIALGTLVNGVPAETPPGPEILVGDPVLWAYIVTNLGTGELTDVAVSGPVNIVVSCPSSVLAPSDEMTCTGETLAQAGAQAVEATAHGLTESGESVAATGVSHYFGVSHDFGVSPQAMKRRVMEALLALASTGDAARDRHIARAVERLDEGLNPSWWVTESTLDPESGKYVFDRARQALNRMSKAIDIGGTEAGQLERLQDQLIAADRSLAELAIGAARAGGATARVLRRAERWMDVADEAVTMQNWNRALHNYKRAWRLSVRALST